MAFEKTLLFVAISVTLSSCWIHSAGANPVPTEDENQLDQVKFCIRCSLRVKNCKLF
jgi:hypothetical protein